MNINNQLHKLAMKLGSNPRIAFARLIQGGLLFVFGSLILIMSDRILASSYSQEVLALFGITIASIGVFWTLLGYLSMSVLRIYHMIKSKDKK
ncbi:hypothetical protein O1D97_08505 [Marinomonas sp. 15G1-11]|uniref:Uncharacterized protein n=1 Tax=Marinomonas phaeophyticola TaxID=3004091 RepID=A0ABT4JTG3_9GAMM|nr:hypothetical protein [Marinomonas sp. 15G1-11]MCZ2721692.1 hypothetical protein [Marinomonas sp. 15G1-11]